MSLSRLQDTWNARRLLENAREVARARHEHSGVFEARFRDGRRLELRGGHSDYHVFNRIFLRDEYQLGDVDRFETVVDLGANIGCFSLRVRPQAGRVVAVEPEPENFARLRRNVGTDPGVETVQQAVGGEIGKLVLRRAAGGRLGGRTTQFAELAPNLLDEEIEVPMTTLETLFRECRVDRCDLLKVDVEGGEYDIFDALPPDTWERIRRIAGEYHNVRPKDPRTRIEALCAQLEGAGFRVRVEPSHRHVNHGLFFAERP